jgi:hypothetical protein
LWRLPIYASRRPRQAVLQPIREISVGHGQTRKGFVVIACLVPNVLVWDRQAGIHGHGGRPTDEFAALCAQLPVDWLFCEPADPQAKGVVQRLQGYAETNSEPGRTFANEVDFQDQLDAWFSALPRLHRNPRASTADRSWPTAGAHCEAVQVGPVPAGS